MSIETLVWSIPIFPLLAFALIVLFTSRWRALSHSLAIGGALLAWLGSMIVFWKAVTTEGLAENPIAAALDWLPIGDTWLRMGVRVDPLSAVVLFFVSCTILMIFIYSVGYHNYGQPEGDHDHPGLPPHGKSEKDEHGHRHKVPSVEPMYGRFFAFISLFAFAMYLLVLTDNLLALYIGWEIMGFCSYLLIGFWYAKKSARDAAVKAFLTTRVGDVFMLLGLAIVYYKTGSLSYHAIFDGENLKALAGAISPVLGLSWAGLIGLLLFMGVVGKSAQFPLHVWLPDAMEGPTPVSAMIHAATMVSAGVYLVIRIFPLISAGWEPGLPLNPTMMIIAFIGSFTALFAATIAVAQNDVKRVLAYSTISQLGYMIAALGIGAYMPAVFHLVTHAFFKALLFLGSGSIIHGMEHGVLHTGENVDPQDMTLMGGLKKKMPVTFWTFLIGGLALSGFPLITAGFWSKDEILSGAFNGEHLAVFFTLAAAALLTAFYTMRQITLTFLGEPRTKSAEHAHESKWTMTLPLVVLSVFAIGYGWLGVPKGFPVLGNFMPHWFQEFVGSMMELERGVPKEGDSIIPLLTSLVVALGGLFLGWWVYREFKTGAVDPLQKVLGGFHSVLKNKYYIDEIYSKVILKPAEWLSETFSYKWIDQTIIDGFLHSVVKMGLGLGKGLRGYFDTPVINGAGDELSTGTRNLGGLLRNLQKGREQRYMIFAIMCGVVIGFVLYFVLGVA